MAGYSVFHRRLGSAKERSCVVCGNPADQWAYNNAGVEELISKEGLRYSENPSDYQPMCYSHHIKMDAEYRLGDTCPQGHSRAEYEIRDKYGWRQCKRCHNDRANLARKRRAESSPVV